jgi:hypothetical protein
MRSVVRTVFFDKKKYTVTMIDLSEMDLGGVSIRYLECR